MTDRSPMERFLGLNSNADPIEVLGLEPMAVTEEAVGQMLARRLAMVAEHPDGDTKAGRAIQQHLRDAAAALADPNSRRQILARHMPSDQRLDRIRVGHGAVAMTSFDRQVFSILKTSGGWNRQSRVRLMSLATSHGLPPEELMKVLTGMARWLRSGTANAVSVAVSEGGWVDPSVPAHPGSEAFDRFVDRWTPALRRTDRTSITQLAVIFSSSALLLMALLLGVIVSTPESLDRGAVLSSKPDRVSEVVRNQPSPRGTSPADLGLPSPSPERIRIPPFTLPQTFTDAADGLGDTLLGLRLLTDEVAAQGLRPADSERFEKLFRRASRGWVLGSPETRASLQEAVAKLMIALGDDGTAAASLLSVMKPAEPGRIDLEVIPVAAWQSGVLAMLAADDRLSPGIRDRAQLVRSTTLRKGEDAGAFAAGAQDWLARRRSRLIDEVEISSEAEAAWAVWQACVRALDDSGVSQMMLLDAAEQLLRRGLMVGRAGPTRRVLGRLLRDLDYRESAAVRNRILGLYLDLDLSSNRLAELSRVLGGLAVTEWFDLKSQVDPLATSAQRRRQHDGLVARWPAPRMEQWGRRQPVPAGFDPALATLWHSLGDEIRRASTPNDDPSRLNRLLQLRRMNESAAALAAGEAPMAAGVLRYLERGADASSLTAPDVDTGLSERPRVAAGWARRLSKASGSDRKVEVLEELKYVRPGELTPRDAAMLVRVAYQGPLRVKQLAWGLIEQRLSDDPEVVIALLDRLPDRPGKAVVESLSLILDIEVPIGDTVAVRRRLQRGLVEYALVLRASGSGPLEVLLEDYVTSARQERSLLGGENRLSLSRSDLGLALQGLYQQRLENLRDIGGENRPATVRDIERRQAFRERLATNGLQQALVRLVGILEVVVVEWSWRLPQDASRLQLIVDDTLAGLRTETSVIDQLIRIEEALAEVWSVILERYSRRVQFEWKDPQS